jgi:DNA-binding LacI/PurR family transcriptional regulator
MKPLPRSTLASDAMSALRDAIATGEWQRTLPGELDLCRELRISRATLRSALAGLEREGLIEGGQGKSRRIKIQVRPKFGSTRSRVIVMLSPQPMHRLGTTTLYWLDCLRKDLADAGYCFEVVVNPGLYGSNSARRVERWLAETRVTGLLLYRSTPAMQGWIEKTGCPAVIAGSRAEDIALPAVDIDYASACRHAVGQLRAYGHNHLALLLPRSGLAGDLESERGFREGLEQTRNPKVSGRVVHHDGTRGSVVSALRALQRQSPLPTGYLVAHAAHALTVVGYLADRGARFRGSTAVISRDDDPILEHVVPSIARYMVDLQRFSQAISKALLLAVSSRGNPCEDLRLLPRFVRGETLM